MRKLNDLDDFRPVHHPSIYDYVSLFLQYAVAVFCVLLVIALCMVMAGEGGR